jgi:hypothetical protein
MSYPTSTNDLNLDGVSSPLALAKDLDINDELAWPSVNVLVGVGEMWTPEEFLAENKDHLPPDTPIEKLLQYNSRLCIAESAVSNTASTGSAPREGESSLKGSLPPSKRGKGKVRAIAPDGVALRHSARTLKRTSPKFKVKEEDEFEARVEKTAANDRVSDSQADKNWQ